MTILYDWNKILQASDRKVARIVAIFDMLVYGRKIRNKFDLRRLYKDKDFSGDGFMLNPKGLLMNWHSCSLQEAAQYIMLAGLRSYAEYIMTGDASLDIRKCPVSLDTIAKNRLLKIDGNRILFLYEEN